MLDEKQKDKGSLLSPARINARIDNGACGNIRYLTFIVHVPWLGTWRRTRGTVQLHALHAPPGLSSYTEQGWFAATFVVSHSNILRCKSSIPKFNQTSILPTRPFLSFFLQRNFKGGKASKAARAHATAQKNHPPRD